MCEHRQLLNLIRQFNAFNQKKIGTLKPQAVALYIALLDVANQASFAGGVTNTISIDNNRLLQLSAIGNKKTLALHRQALVDNGFIDYTQGGQGKVGAYRIIKLY